jgi:hypothetical protein
MTTIDKLKSKVPDLLTLAGQSAKLFRRGSSYVGLCPFHKEKTPSFTISPQTDHKRFKCWGCGASGDALDFIARTRGATIEQIVGDLAKEYGIDPDKPLSAAELAAERKKKADRAAAEPESDWFWTRMNTLLARRIHELEDAAKASDDLPEDLTTWAREHTEDESPEADAKFDEIFQLLDVQAKAAKHCESLANYLRAAQDELVRRRHDDATLTKTIVQDAWRERTGKPVQQRSLYTAQLVDFYFEIARHDQALRKRARQALAADLETAGLLVSLLVMAEDTHSIYDPELAQRDTEGLEKKNVEPEYAHAAVLENGNFGWTMNDEGLPV